VEEAEGGVPAGAAGPLLPAGHAGPRMLALGRLGLALPWALVLEREVFSGRQVSKGAEERLRTCEASAAARDRAASLLTFPVRVATPLWTVDCMGSELSAPSLEIRLCKAAVRVLSSAGTVGAELLHPEKLRATAKTVVARRARVAES